MFYAEVFLHSIFLPIVIMFMIVVRQFHGSGEEVIF